MPKIESAQNFLARRHIASEREDAIIDELRVLPLMFRDHTMPRCTKMPFRLAGAKPPPLLSCRRRLRKQRIACDIRRHARPLLPPTPLFSQIFLRAGGGFGDGCRQISRRPRIIAITAARNSLLAKRGEYYIEQSYRPFSRHIYRLIAFSPRHNAGLSIISRRRVSLR